MSKNNTDYTVSVEELLELIDSLDVRFDKDTMTPAESIKFIKED